LKEGLSRLVDTKYPTHPVRKTTEIEVGDCGMSRASSVRALAVQVVVVVDSRIIDQPLSRRESASEFDMLHVMYYCDQRLQQLLGCVSALL